MNQMALQRACDDAVTAVLHLESLVGELRTQTLLTAAKTMERDLYTRVVNSVSVVTGVPIRHIMKTKPRTARIAHARMMVAWIMREIQPEKPLIHLATLFGCCHGTANYRLEVAKDLMETDPSFRQTAQQVLGIFTEKKGTQCD